MLQGALSLIYGCLCWFACYLSLKDLAGLLLQTDRRFLEPVPTNVPKFIIEVFINCVLLGFFTLTHSYMCSPSVKNFWRTKISSISFLERSTYVLITSICIEALAVFWQPISGLYLWRITDPDAIRIIHLLNMFGWITIVIRTFTMDHLELIGIRQILWYINSEWEENRDPHINKSEEAINLYRSIRHPIVTSLMFVLWPAQVMTLDRFFLSVGFSLYLFCFSSIQVENLDYVYSQLIHNYESWKYHLNPFSLQPNT